MRRAIASGASRRSSRPVSGSELAEPAAAAAVLPFHTCLASFAKLSAERALRLRRARRHGGHALLL